MKVKTVDQTLQKGMDERERERERKEREGEEKNSE